MKLTCISRELHPRRAFRISRARRTEVRNVFIRLESEGVVGYGEASPNSFYGETWEGVSAHLESARPFIDALQVRSVADIEAAWNAAWRFLAPSRGAQCALDIALWDWLARKRGVTVSELAWNQPPQPVSTFATIGLSSPEELAEKIEELHGFACIKIKSDQSAGLDAVRLVRERTSALVAVDANGAWGEVDLPRLARELQQLGVTFIEQPWPPARDADLPKLELPVMADESCVTEEDAARLADPFDGFNIKLVKCGGITPARRMVETGKARGKKMMVGCMLESSALIAAGAVIAQRTDYADLDGAWLLRDDPFTGWAFDHGILSPRPEPGLGVEPESGLFPQGSSRIY
ncbi:MAG: dipeptide epimerase [Chthoniobacter sp.]|uniref:dipeptide epimerase n=1 Tax=Chthoniobacter sp. TaxID=2510640 RepID=UPI0032A391AD